MKSRFIRMLSNEKVFKIFVDFDGTITRKDVGEELFIEFGEKDFCRNLIYNWNAGKVIPRDGWKSLCESVGTANRIQMLEYLREVEIDTSFKNFKKYSDENGFDMKIISDGFDFYINTILDKENISGVEISSNRLEFAKDGKLIPYFPNSADDCKCSANCKRNFVLNNSSDDDFTVYIGDGVSDRCPVQYCDFIFAKGSLLKFCEINRITYFPYSTFVDVIKKLDELKNKKRLKKRHQAELKRKEVYTQEA